MDILEASDICDVRNGGEPSEEEAAFIPNFFLIEDTHRCCWSLFTDTSDEMVRFRSVLVRPDLKASTGEGDGSVDILSRHPPPPLKFVPRQPLDLDPVHFSHLSLSPSS